MISATSNLLESFFSVHPWKNSQKQTNKFALEHRTRLGFAAYKVTPWSKMDSSGKCVAFFKDVFLKRRLQSMETLVKG